MHFSTKSYLKSNRYYTAKHPRRQDHYSIHSSNQRTSCFYAWSKRQKTERKQKCDQFSGWRRDTEILTSIYFLEKISLN